MKENYQLTTDEIKKEYQLTDFTHGLSTQAVEKRLADEGRNIIEVKPTPSGNYSYASLTILLSTFY